MRDIGYSLETAIADLIDNSISAGAKTIDVDIITFENGNLCLAVRDDGSGMTYDELLEAMRPGSRHPRSIRDADDLGRFGLGLKTASFSQCKSLTVLTRKNDVTLAAQWDLDLISSRNEWVATLLDQAEIEQLPFADRLAQQGTCIIWQKLDRLTEGNQGAANPNIYDKLETVEKHLALIFHRYLSGEYRKRRVVIRINGHPIQAFDPFFRTNRATQALHEEVVRIEGHEVTIEPFILPHHSKLSRAEYDFYHSRNDFFSNQGAYVYRNGRLMAWGDWFRLISKSEAFKLARVRIDFPNALDEYWTIDIKKSRAYPPPQVREKLRQIIDRITEESKNVHKGRAARLFSQQQHPVWHIQPDRKGLRYSVNREHPLLTALRSKIDTPTWNALTAILSIIEENLPVEAIYADYSVTPHTFEEKPELSDEMLQTMLTSLSELFRVSGTLDKKRLMSAALMLPGFSQHHESIEKIIGEMM